MSEALVKLCFMPNRAQVTLRVADPIGDCPTHGTSMNLPIAVLRRLDQMGLAARRVRASRNELLAAFVATTNLDAATLEELIDRYRRMSIGDVLPDEPTKAGDVVVPLRKPGRPAQSSAT
jgi:hypothetical protein